MGDDARVRRLGEHGEADGIPSDPCPRRNLPVEIPDERIDSRQDGLNVLVAAYGERQAVLGSGVQPEEIAERPAEQTRFARFTHQVLGGDFVIVDLVVAR